MTEEFAVPVDPEVPVATGGEMTPSGDVSNVVIPGGHPALAVTPEMAQSVSSPSRFHVSARLDDQGGVSCQIGAVASWAAPGAQGETVVNFEVPPEELDELERVLAGLVERYRAQAMQTALADGYEAHKVNYRGIPPPTPSPSGPEV